MEFIIRRKIFILMLFTAFSLLGIFSYRQLPVELLPNTQIPYLFVQISSNLQTDPAYIENQAVIPIEGAIGTLKGVEKIESTADQQFGMIQISYRQNANLKLAHLKLLEKMEEVRKKIPSDFFIQVVRFDMEQLNNALMTIQVRGSGGVDRIRELVNREIVNPVGNIDGIAQVAVFGGRERSIEISLREDVCRTFGITPSDVRNALNRNSLSRTFAGKVTQDNRMIFINVMSEYEDLSDIRELVVREPGSVKLKDISEIRFGHKNQDSYSRVNGKESVTMTLTRDTQSNLIDLSHRVKREIEKLNRDLKQKDIELVIQENSADRMEKNIDLIINLAMVGGLLAIFILWIFLNNIRLVVAIGLSIPVSVFVAFNFFYAAGISINSLTLLGMALAIGMLVDNSVVVMENIYRLSSQGMEPDKAVIQGTTEVWRSILAATLTTVAVFLPFAFSENFLVGVLGKHIGVSIISTMLVSLVVAMILVPMITHVFLVHRKARATAVFSTISTHNRLIQVYVVLLKTCMRKPAQTIMGALALFFITLLISLGLSFIKKEEPAIIELSLYATMPGGTTLDNTDLMVADVEQRLEKLKEKKDIISRIYEEEAVITVSLPKDYRKIRNFTIPKIKREILNSLGGLEPASFSWDPPLSGRRFGRGGGEDMGMEGFLGIGNQVEKVIIKGENYDQIVSHANLVKYYLSQQQNLNEVKINVPSAEPEIVLGFDKQLMSLYDIPATSVLSELNAFPQQFSSGMKFRQENEEFDIRIRMETVKGNRDKDLNDLKVLPVRGRNAIPFELQHISSFNFSNGATSIKRVNQQKQLEVEYSFVDGVKKDKDLLEEGRMEIESLLAGMRVPPGVAMELVHDQQDLSDFRFLIFAAFILIYMILASVFESFTKPVVLMFAIPLASIGSLTALILTGSSLLNANTLTGFVILIGIVVNNGIILLDYSNVLQKRGYQFTRSLVMAGLARVRPILITSLTTIIALFPLAMGKAEYVTQIGAPFAITVIGGLGLSTLLTLVFIPTMNSGLQSALIWLKSQKPLTRLFILVAYLAGGLLIYIEVNSLVWKIIDIILLIILLPASLYFVRYSLRRANEKLIDEAEPLHIRVRNLVKIYERDSRFMREWKSGLKIRERLGLGRSYRTWRDFEYIIWLLPLIAFMVYFIYFYLESGFWFYFLPIGLYMMVLSLVAPLSKQDYITISSVRKQRLHKITKGLYSFIFWVMPLVIMVIFYRKYKLIGLLIPTFILWYLILMIKNSSDKLYREKININRLKGRFKGIRKAFLRFVLVIPVIGRKKIPFKALKGISFDIEHGMFGLLGPNGAGKSTLMRIICGILEPSYGQITINDIDIKTRREELQGLIGYLPQEFGMYENLTAWEFLHFMGIMKKLLDRKNREERVAYVLNAVHMTEHKDEKIGSYSGGMKQRIGIAQILLHLPRILVVDEPTAGLDPRERIRFRNLLVELSKERIVIFSTHIIEDVSSSCNQVAVIKNGEVKYLGEPIQMALIAEGKVWMADMEISLFEDFKQNFVIIHHMRDGNSIRVRCIADACPAAGARSVKANLEDAYLYLLLKT